MTARQHRLCLPLSEGDVRQLRAGDSVILDGEIVITAGLPTHGRIMDCIASGTAPPVDLSGAALFHLGGYSREGPQGFELLYLNPTTSTRFNPMMPTIIRHFGLRAVGGKGGLDAQSAAAMREVGCVYLSFLGGGCTVLSEAVREVVTVGWNDMISHYRLARLRVEGLGPATVGIDAHGNSIYDRLQGQAQDRLPQILEQLAKDRGQPS